MKQHRLRHLVPTVATLWGLFASALTSAAAAGEAIYKVAVKSSSGNRLILRFTAEPGPFSPGDGTCVYRNRKAIACGSVISSDANSVELRLMRGVTKFNADERILLRANDKFNLAEGNKTEDVKGATAGAKPPVLQKLNISTGVTIFAPATYFLIPLTIEFKIASKTSFGIEPFYATSGKQLSIIGVDIFMNYYFKEMYRRLFFFLGVGYYSVTGKANDDLGNPITEKIGSFTVKFGLGNRWVFGKSFNMSLMGGGLYLTKVEGANLNFGFNQFSALVGLSFGLLF